MSLVEYTVYTVYTSMYKMLNIMNIFGKYEKSEMQVPSDLISYPKRISPAEFLFC